MNSIWRMAKEDKMVPFIKLAAFAWAALAVIAFAIPHNPMPIF